MKEAVSVVTTFVFVASFGSAVAQQASPCSSPPPLPNIIAQLINLYRIALSQKTAGRPLPPLSPCETAALQRAMALPDPDYPAQLSPLYLPHPPFYAQPQYFPSMFAAPPPPMFNPIQASDPSHLQPYPQPQMIPQPQAVAQPQPILQPQQVFSPPQSIPHQQAISPQQYSTPTDIPVTAPPVVYFVSSETVNPAPVYYSEPIQYARRPEASIPNPQVVASTPKPCGCKKSQPQQVYQYAPTVQGASPQTPFQAATQAAQTAQYAQASQAAQTLQARQASFAQQISPTPQVMPPNQLVQRPQVEVVAQPAQAAPAQTYAGPQVTQESQAQQPHFQYQYQTRAVPAP